MPRSTGKKTSRARPVSPQSALSSILKTGRANTLTKVSDVSKIPRSTLWTWEHRGIKTEQARQRLTRAAPVVEEAFKVDRRHALDLAGQLKQIDTIKQTPRLARDAHRSPATVQSWYNDLRAAPTVDVVDKVEAALKASEEKTRRVDSGDIVRREARTEEATVVARYENYEGVSPPKDADGYRIFGVNRHGEIITSTVEADNWDDAVSLFGDATTGDTTDSWEAVVDVIIQLIYDVA